MELRNIWTHGEPSQPSQDRMKSEGIKALDVANHIANIEMLDFLEIAYIDEWAPKLRNWVGKILPQAYEDARFDTTTGHLVAGQAL